METHLQPVGNSIAVVRERGKGFFSRFLARLGLWLVERFIGRQALAASANFSQEYAQHLIERISEQHRQIVFNDDVNRSMPDARIVADLKGRILEFNDAAKDLFQIDKVTACAQFTFWQLCADSTTEQEAILRLLRLENQVHNIRTAIRSVEGKTTHVLLSLRHVRDTEGNPIALVSMIRDNDALERQQNTDHLTKVWDRERYDRQLAEELTRLQRGVVGEVSLLFIDLDNFKQINDEHGHRTGDEALRRTGEVLHDCVRDIDTPARYGGEEFAVILPGADAAHAKMVAERIRQKIAGIRITSGKTGEEVRFTASIGVSTRGVNRSIMLEQFVREMEEQADQAMYQAKHSGRNQTCVYTPQ
ncbi:MAG: diguanylate cyclase [Patescibacteria group bacterium]